MDNWIKLKSESQWNQESPFGCISDNVMASDGEDIYFGFISRHNKLTGANLSSGDMVYNVPVTHYMPIPKPPKEE